jgi:hypothetical protein
LQDGQRPGHVERSISTSRGRYQGGQEEGAERKDAYSPYSLRAHTVSLALYTYTYTAGRTRLTFSSKRRDQRKSLFQAQFVFTRYIALVFFIQFLIIFTVLCVIRAVTHTFAFKSARARISRYSSWLQAPFRQPSGDVAFQFRKHRGSTFSFVIYSYCKAALQQTVSR